MPRQTRNDGLRRYWAYLAGREMRGWADDELLNQFVTGGDEAAFGALMERHGGMVLGVCRRVLRHVQDAEDACQATFLVLARKAGSIWRRESLSCWLHGVAYRVALRLKAEADRRICQPSGAIEIAQAISPTAVPWQEAMQVLDEELNRLPATYRAPLVLCYLEGKTQDEAARHLGWTLGAFRGRLERGRDKLRHRLLRRGITLSAVLFGVGLASTAAGAWNSTIKAATHVAAGGAAARVVSARVAALTEGVLKTMFLSKLKAAAAAVVLVVLAAAGVGYLAGPVALARPSDDRAARDDKPTDKKDAAKPTPTWELRTKLDGHKGRVDSVAFSPDGKLLATASHDGSVKVWDLAKGQAVATLEGHEGQVNQVTFSPDGKTVATAGEDKTARLWEVPRGVEVQKVVHSHPIYSVAFTPDGKTLLAGGGPVGQPKRGDREAVEGQGELHLWDPATGKERASVTGHSERVSALIFASDGKTLLSGGSDNTFKVWDFDGKDQLKERSSVEAGGTQGLYGLALAPNGKTAAFISNAGLKLYDLAAGKPGDDLEKTHDAFWDEAAFSPDGKVLAANSWIQERDGNFLVTQRSLIRLWDVATGKVLDTLEVKEVIESLAFAPDGKTLVAAGRGKHKVPVQGDTLVLKPGDVDEEMVGPVLLFGPTKSPAK